MYGHLENPEIPKHDLVTPPPPRKKIIVEPLFQCFMIKTCPQQNQRARAREIKAGKKFARKIRGNNT